MDWSSDRGGCKCDRDLYRQCSTSDLISNQLSTANQTIRNTYKQRLPFEINLNMEGQLLKPIITFDIKLPTNKNYGVSNDVISTTNTRLTQLRQEPAELNKQVLQLYY